jgi:A118 family predicted phage portal protein
MGRKGNGISQDFRLYRSYNPEVLGNPVSLASHPDYRALPEQYTFEIPVGSVGLVQLKTPMLNCVDGSADGVSVYAAAAGLIHNIDRNEFQLSGEFERGQSRVFASGDLLRDGALSDHLFVGLDDDPEHVGLTVFSPQLREQSFLARKQEYLRNVESVIGLKRGMLSDANVDQRTATEIPASEAEHNLTVMDFQNMWQKALIQAVGLCAVLGRLYRINGAGEGSVSVDWGNGVLYDEDKLWQDYKDMAQKGLIRPEIALGWRFGMPTDTEEDLAAIRGKYMVAGN